MDKPVPKWHGSDGPAWEPLEPITRELGECWPSSDPLRSISGPEHEGGQMREEGLLGFCRGPQADAH